VTKVYGSTRGHDFGETTEKIIAAALEVHRVLGPGFQEVVYQRALEEELKAAGLDFAREASIPVYYKGIHIDTRRVDFLIEDCIVEMKARSELLDEDYIQTLSYLKASRYRTALLLNFGAKSLGIKRLVNEKGKWAYAPDS